jgi:hypothetical protein
MKGFYQILTIQEVLLVKINLREILGPAFHLHAAGRAGSVAATVMGQRES